ncbi:SDR family oxidoreductase [Nocardioides albus]|uniref:NAD(P)-dependent dehydrogenase (Short-subunit alcohol dehydrogenase family) n=1 Tax=Nocardioides albus TaxID=1841 RepID=A0A7W5F896_9ACTN|nr:SDR family oxidoreductase [Nocardioides albus]MBB3089004.1 NAD(P)-dependent dehydrogenase (short-subunit alcohol dehydrogenase family) [Nocardioides albus]GGU14876.1 gluconate 5-dehydrogenase [Nocardioides albus]
MELDNLFSLAGRSAIVTGGSRGIGRMIAEGFVRSGVRTYITARKAEACDRTAKELSELGHCVSIPADVSSIAGITDFVAAFREHESSLDILVNNAGAAWAEPFDEFPESGWDKVMDLNVKTPFFLTQALKSDLVAASGTHLAKVINIASIDGISLNPLETYSYHASKAGLIQLTRRMGVRLIEEGIAVSAIAPGAFASNMNKEARDHADKIVGHIPAKRIGATEDMAGAAIFLASRAGDYVVGSTITVDGGVTHAR